MSRWARAVQLLRTSFLLHSGLLLLALLLLLPWPGIARFYGATFCSFANEAADFALNAGTAPLEFTPTKADAGADLHAWEVVVSARDESTHALVQTALDLRRTVYLPSAVFFALALAVRVPLWKKVGLVAIGLGALQLGPVLTLLSFFSGKLAVQVFHLAPVTTWPSKSPIARSWRPPAWRLRCPRSFGSGWFGCSRPSAFDTCERAIRC